MAKIDIASTSYDALYDKANQAIASGDYKSAREELYEASRVLYRLAQLAKSPLKERCLQRSEKLSLMVIETKTEGLVDKIDFASYQNRVNTINEMIEKKTGAGNDFLGWVDWPINYDKKELETIIKEADYVRKNYDILVVCGIGGSYLGARAAIEAINGVLPNQKLEILYLGQTFDPTYLAQHLDYLKDKKFAVNVISKSGTTTETSVSFRLLKEMLEKRDGVAAARKAIIATTDKAHDLGRHRLRELGRPQRLHRVPSRQPREASIRGLAALVRQDTRIHKNT